MQSARTLELKDIQGLSKSWRGMTEESSTTDGSAALNESLSRLRVPSSHLAVRNMDSAPSEELTLTLFRTVVEKF